MKCIFQTGYLKDGVFHDADSKLVRNGGVCDPHNPAQRLARQPLKTEKQYKHELRIERYIERHMRCNSRNGACNGWHQSPRAPKTWVIGACAHFLQPHDRLRNEELDRRLRKPYISEPEHNPSICFDQKNEEESPRRFHSRKMTSATVVPLLTLHKTI